MLSLAFLKSAVHACEQAPCLLAASLQTAHIWAMDVVTVNGESRPLLSASTIAALLVELGLNTSKIAVERNEAIVPRSCYATTRVQAGDRLEIVHFIGGG